MIIDKLTNRNGSDTGTIPSADVSRWGDLNCIFKSKFYNTLRTNTILFATERTANSSVHNYLVYNANNNFMFLRLHIRRRLAPYERRKEIIDAEKCSYCDPSVIPCWTHNCAIILTSRWRRLHLANNDPNNNKLQ